jgi:CRP-like cAMP-binding protein
MTRARPANRLLARLPEADYRRLLPHLHAVPLAFRQVLHRARTAIEHVYFPARGVCSALTVMSDGAAIEVASVGSEGMVGLSAVFGAGTSPNEVIVQVAGEALRVTAEELRDMAAGDGPLRRRLVLYHDAYQAQVSYSVACNGLHQVAQRCCRWLLMTHDRAGSDALPLTHEFLAIMLGVRRASVTEVLRPLQERGLIATGRGQITVLDRAGLEAASCECYRRAREEYDRLLG